MADLTFSNKNEKHKIPLPKSNWKNGPSWLWSYGSWIYNYLRNQCLSPLKLWVRTSFTARCTRYNIMWKSLSVTCDRSLVFSGYSVSSTNKIDRHDMAEILLKVALKTIKQTKLIEKMVEIGQIYTPNTDTSLTGLV